MDAKSTVAVEPELPPLATPLPVASDQLGYEVLKILNDSHVQDELVLRRDQLAAIDALVQEYLLTSAQIQAAAFRALNQSGADSAAVGAEMNLKREVALRGFGNRAIAALTPAQHRRLDEIMFQLRSIDIFSEPAFVAALRLSDDQQRGIGAIFGQTAKALRDLRTDLAKHKLERTPYEQQVHEGLVAAEQRVDALLTAEQVETLTLWRGNRIAFGRMHLRLVLRGKPQIARN